MDQDPKVTLEWALRSLERAIQHLEDGWAERRVRRQFHQLLLAVEREAFRTDDEEPPPSQVSAEVLSSR